MSDDDTKLVNFEIDRDTYETAKEKLEHGEMSEELRGRMTEIAFGTEATKREQLREQLEDLRSNKRELDTEIATRQEKREEIDRKIARVEDQLDSIRDADSEYNGALEMLESQLHDGERLFPQHDGVTQAANISQKPVQEVIADLQSRNPEVPEYAFELSSPNEPTDWRNVE